MPLLYAGIDEAGYGPLLGPLCVGCSMFLLPEVREPALADVRPPCLWRALAPAVCRTTTDRRHRIAIEDSKKLKGAKDAVGHPLRHLERGVSAFASACPGAPSAWESDAALLAALGASPTAPPVGDAWHSETLPLPMGNDAPALRIAASMLRTTLTKCNMSCLELRVRAIDAREFNAQAAQISNKATINFMAAMRHVERVRVAAVEHGIDAWIALDRQGGRTSYREPLQTSFPEARIRIIDESDALSRYRLEFPAIGAGATPAHGITISFELGGEGRNLPIALASMAAKFTRELHMRRMNAFFAHHVAELKPTAGYVQDGRRWMEQVGPAARTLGIPDEALVRTR